MLKSIKSAIKRVLMPTPTQSFGPLSDAASQKSLLLLYQTTRMANSQLRIHDTGFKVYSQTDEDGILLYLLSVIGFRTRLCVEICAGDGRECNTANLIINHGFHGLLIDGNQELVDRGRLFYSTHPATYVFPPTFIQAWITRCNVNQIIESNGFSGSVDVLSLDLDGVDYWIWEAIDVIRPRIVVLEYQDILGPDLSLTVPYSDDFSGYAASATAGMPDFAGASLRAFVKLAQRKGYRLVATNKLGYNAFFVHQDIPQSVVPSVQIEQCFTHPKVVDGMKNRFPKVRECPWVEV
jgi:hypothetical protein